jgi:glycosyltransferase involved in cell wall biosynthesis
MKIAVNGRFLAAVQTGVQRFALEITRRVLPRADAALLIPRGAEVPDELSRHAEVVEGRLRGHAWEQMELPELARRVGADVCLGLANAVPASGGPHAVVLHDAIVFEHPEWFGARYGVWHRRVLLPAARRAAAVGSLSGDAAAALSRVLGRPASEIPVIGQGAAPIDAPADPAAVSGVRRRLGLDGPFLLALGGSDPRKNVPFLEKVMLEWRTGGGSPPTLVVAGGGPSGVFAPVRGPEGRRGLPAPEERAGKRPPHAPGEGAGDRGRGFRVVHLGRVDDDTLRALYTGAAAFCFPSLAEGFGRPPLEALACGTPAVVAPYGPAREVLGDAAEILPLDVRLWVAALERLVTDGPPAGFGPRTRALLGRHRWEDGADAVIALCARAAARSEGRPGRAPSHPARSDPAGGRQRTSATGEPR